MSKKSHREVKSRFLTNLLFSRTEFEKEAMWLDVFKWPEMIKYKKERDDQFAGTEGMFDRNRILKS